MQTVKTKLDRSLLALKQCRVREYCSLFADISEPRKNCVTTTMLTDIWGGETPTERIRRKSTYRA